MAKTNRNRTNSTSRRRAHDRANVITADNDNYSEALSDIVPKEYRGSDRYLDVIQWNIEWFGAAKSRSKDARRFALVQQILQTLNADLFIFQEIAGPSPDGRREGVLDPIARALTETGAGDYAVDYTLAGGEQRVAMMWDRDWIRAKDDVKELFPKGTHKMPGGQADAFAGRTPLYGYFTARIPIDLDDIAPNPTGGLEKFDFQALGVHLKAMADGAPQREESARVLAAWLQNEALVTDNDTLIMGDFNAPPGDKCWDPFAALENAPNSKVKFRSINDPSDFSYMWLANRTTKFTSKIDLAVISLASADQIVGKPAQVVRWKPIQDVIAETGDMTKAEVVAVLREMKETISDHLPVLHRFYLTQ
ncbi:MAG: endonuclease/exonuclease/phosphatase family protein [Verrucomicrobiota bacterium]|nr:endonuclease/exonuclease/phosphatase family protein [Verrucomicrobiota bacterium]